ncbi:hypothetical protein [Kribbella sp. NPDC000426]|uniref:hypothetical protein n=1 Tax=Kribbella sp. NPDC000426 TaxID=3154255 RepID=UPI003318D44A
MRCNWRSTTCCAGSAAGAASGPHWPRPLVWPRRRSPSARTPRGRPTPEPRLTSPPRRHRRPSRGGLPRPLIAGLPPKWIAVIADGRMVGRATVATTAEAVELQPRQSNVLDARIDVRSCTGGPLPTGSYQLYEDLPEPTKTTEPIVDTNPIGTIQLR